MIRITASEFKTVPWKNGKGITQQIVTSADRENYDWRFSRADVSADGPFSIFEGKSRILTVIEGTGLSLISSAFTIEATPFEPVCFSGELEVTGKLRDGPVKDLNLIYSSKRIHASAQFIQGEDVLQLSPDQFRFFTVYCINGVINPDSGPDLNSGDFGMIKNKPCTIRLNNQSQLLLFSLKLIN